MKIIKELTLKSIMFAIISLCEKIHANPKEENNKAMVEMAYILSEVFQKINNSK